MNISRTGFPAPEVGLQTVWPPWCRCSLQVPGTEGPQPPQEGTLSLGTPPQLSLV